MKPGQAPYTLYTFAMSHYSEKIRWTLDHAGLPYQEVRMTPAFHVLPALLMGGRGRTTLPILRTPQGTIQDSARILDWLESCHAPFELVPAALHDEIRAVEQRFNAIGKDVARALYAAGFGRGDDYIIRLWTDFATPRQAGVIRRGYPVIRWVFRRKLNITEAGARRAAERIDGQIDWLAQQVRQKPYLVGGRFSVADITAASLLAPLACPPEHPVYGQPGYQDIMAPAMAPWQGSPALAWVRRVYEQHRQPPARQTDGVV